jgi:hypothetical protein
MTDNTRTEANAPSEDSPRGQLMLGFLLVGIGAMVAAANFLTTDGEWVIAGIGLVVLAVFAVTRWDWALIWGGIQTGAGVGVLLVSANEDAGGLFLLGLGAGFLFVALGSVIFRFAEHRLWPLIPGGILVALGGGIQIGLDAQLDTLFSIGWPLALLGAGLYFLVRAFRRTRGGA